MTVIASWELFDDPAQDELLRIGGMPAQRLKVFGDPLHPGMSAPPWPPPVDISERRRLHGGG